MPYSNGRFNKKPPQKRKFKQQKQNKQPSLTNSKGNWAYSHFQKMGKHGLSINEQLIKSNLSHGSLDPSKIIGMIEGHKTKEELVLEKSRNGSILNSREKIILSSHLEKTSKEINYDLTNLEKHGLNANVKTDEGRIRKLLLVAKYQLKKEDYDNVYYVYQKLREFSIPENVMSEFSSLFKEINDIVETLDIIKLQFLTFHFNMPPLNNTGFSKLEDFQIKVIKNIIDKTSSIITSPTSSGKSVITSFITQQQCKFLIIVPTDILAWQMAAMMGKHTSSDIPIVTKTFDSELEIEDLIKKIKSSVGFVGTPAEVASILPLISDVRFDWLIIDEIHMMGQEGFEDIELIAKAYNHIPFLALSATIGNTSELRDWFLEIGHSNVDMIVCNKRFINQQKYFYKEGEIVKIHPLSMVSIEYFDDESIINRNINVTPPDIWDLAKKLKEVFKDIGDLDLYIHFKDIERIQLDDTVVYYDMLIKFMISKMKDEHKSSENRKKIKKILDSYTCSSLEEEDHNLLDVAFKLKEEKKTPSIFFQIESYKCLDYVKDFSNKIKTAEAKKYPNLEKERYKLQKKAKHLEKKRDQLKIDKLGDKQFTRHMMNDSKENIEELETQIDVSLLEPHPEFVLNHNQPFTSYYIGETNKTLKKFFPMNGDEYHYLIDLLWRGVGVYVKGLPDPYLNIVQQLTCNGKLAIIFSDISLVFGVSMPIRTTTLITNSNSVDNLDSMLYHQMSGRSGRRGWTKMGNNLFVGYSGERIKELSVSKIPNINGLDSLTWGARFATDLANINNPNNNPNNNWDQIKQNFLLKDITNDYALEFYNDIDSNIKSEAWNHLTTADKYLLHLMWKLRYNEKCLKTPYYIDFLKKNYRRKNPTDEGHQVEISHFFCTFIKDNSELPDSDESTLEQLSKYSSLFEILELKQLEDERKIDSRLYQSIRANKLVTCDNKIEFNKLREELMNLGNTIRFFQHYFYYSKEIIITRLIGKLMTRIWWIYHSSSPLEN